MDQILTGWERAQIDQRSGGMAVKHELPEQVEYLHIKDLFPGHVQMQRAVSGVGEDLMALIVRYWSRCSYQFAEAEVKDRSQLGIARIVEGHHALREARCR
jgi:hypothetical protein